MKYHRFSIGDFRCGHCGCPVSASHVLSNVNNRNHCPYCLWSRHLDLHAAGDRLSACKGWMSPIGLTMKRCRNKYRLDSAGELMLIHQCIECGSLSLNRIAADDDSDSILDVFSESQTLGNQTLARCKDLGIAILKDAGILHAQLFGQTDHAPVFGWR